MGIFLKKKKEMITETDIVTDIQNLMEDLGDPTWLQLEITNIVDAKKLTKSNSEIRRWLRSMSEEKGFPLPEEFQNEKKLVSIYDNYQDWTKEQCRFFEEVSYESFEKHLETFPLEIQRMNRKAQEAYFATSTCLLNIFSQL
ncbi:MAG TPA: hypothetical protein VGI04_03410 [Neobacillus sp.]|jgi:hypothetical protein